MVKSLGWKNDVGGEIVGLATFHIIINIFLECIILAR